MDSSFLEMDNRPDYDLILNDLNFSDIDSNSLGKCQFTDDILKMGVRTFSWTA